MLNFKKFYESTESPPYIEESIYLSNCYLTELPDCLKDIEIYGDLNIDKNMLTNLNNSPVAVYGNFYCFRNKLTTLKGMPKTIINGCINLDHNELTNLEYFIEDCSHVNSIDLMYNKLESLKGLPEVCRGSLDLGFNNLTDLKNCSKNIWGSLNISGNPITSLEGFPSRVERSIWASTNFKFSEEELRSVCVFKTLIAVDY